MNNDPTRSMSGQRMLCAVLVACALTYLAAASEPDQQATRMTAERAEELIQTVWARKVRTLKDEYEKELQAGVIKHGDHELRLLEKTFGDEPQDGHSLWISLHGGGGTTADVNTRQWQNQINIYEPKEGIYVAPRGPTDTWNLWHQDHVDPLLDQLIAAYIVARGVNPNRVYLLGYSAGGDGVYQLAPRMADRFAAAAMMAGHPNDARPEGLRNLPFMIFMGGDDAAYNRNKVAQEWGAWLDKLHKNDPGGYVHEVTIYDGLGHWMQGRDKSALPWMAKHTRNPWPKRIVWRQDDVLGERFYWLKVERDDVRPGAQITAEVDGQMIRIQSEGVKNVTLRLSDRLIDFDRPMIIRVNGHNTFRAEYLPRGLRSIEESLNERLDPESVATTVIKTSL